MEGRLSVELSQRTPPPQSARLARAWLLLGIAALGASALYAVVLVVARAPMFGFADKDLFRRALTAHVSLSTLVWALSIAGAVWALRASRVGGIAWTAAVLAALGALGMLLSPFAGGTAYPANYVPTLDNLMFLGGLGLFGAGIVLGALSALRPGALVGPHRGACDVSIFAVLAVALSALASLLLAPPGLSTAIFVEVTAWGPGHVLQLAYIAVMLAAWTRLAADGGLVTGADRWLLRFAAVLAVAPFLIVPRFYIGQPIGDAAARAQFTDLMIWGTWPAAALLIVAFLWRWRASRGEAVARAGLAGSMALFVLGCGFGVAIQDDTTLVPAHYHGTVGALSVALMALVYKLGGDLGMAEVPRGSARLHLLGYAGGTALLSGGLAWAGWLGVPRKMPAGLSEVPAGMFPLLLVALGGLIAIVAVVGFVWVAGRHLLALRIETDPPPSRAALRQRALAAVFGGVVVVGTLITLLPYSSDDAQNLSAHARDKRLEEIDLRFRQGVVMLHANQFEHALTAFHRVLALAPEIPEAHVNLGFALLGLERYQEAADFFDSATSLRRDQINAYYGLALALEGMGDRRGAIEAMRTYVHRAPPQDPYVRKANAALWEWEAQGNGDPPGAH